MADVERTAVGMGRRDFGNLQAAMFALIGTGFFTTMFTAGKFAGDAASPLQIMFLRYLGGALTVICIAFVTRRGLTVFRSDYRRLHFARAIAGAMAGVMLLFGNANMPVVDANAISLLNVVFAVVLGILFLHERPRGIHIIGMAVCVGGAAVVTASRGAFTTFEPQYLLPAAVVLLGAFSIAAESLLIRVLSRADDRLATLAHVNAIGALLLLIPALLTSPGWSPLTFAFLALGPLAIAAQYCNLRAYALADITVLAPISYTSLIFAGAVGWIFFGEAPIAGTLVGAALIATGGITLALTRR